jgi:membrane-bound lytic murein transglycosylase
MGIGERAEALAGRTGAEGELYYLFLKNAQSEIARNRGLTRGRRSK